MKKGSCHTECRGKAGKRTRLLLCFSLPCGALGQFLPLFVAESPFEIILRKTIIENVASLPF